jgi:hypothetical protein
MVGRINIDSCRGGRWQWCVAVRRGGEGTTSATGDRRVTGRARRLAGSRWRWPREEERVTGRGAAGTTTKKTTEVEEELIVHSSYRDSSIRDLF